LNAKPAKLAENPWDFVFAAFAGFAGFAFHLVCSQPQKPCPTYVIRPSRLPAPFA